MRETADSWTVVSGADPGFAFLNKLQVSATLTGDKLGLAGWSAHAQLFRFDGQLLSARMGDIQTADNLEALPMTRLFEAWVAKQWGGDNRSIALRAGLIDLNSQFDSVDPASLFINSSHGIGPDLSRSGRNGPSIYPVTALGGTLTAVPNEKWTFRLGVFDGVPGDPTRPRAFIAERLGKHDGLLTILQTDYLLSKDTRIEAGAWRYTASVPTMGIASAHDQGAYASIETPAPLLPRTTGWFRIGFGDRSAQTVAGYIGFGAVQSGTFANRPDDRLGIAIAHAIIGSPAVRTLGISSAETSVEASYQVKLNDRFAIQPDVQYIVHPAGVAHAPNSLGVGLRLVLTAGFPKKPVATDPSDPTVPPDGAPTTAPTDTPQGSTSPSQPGAAPPRSPPSN
ncbi:MAG TPA: carbohydrate porin [Sphingomicrobium sp.]|nr:carbohydrate porin [Sphingomicrobium sp.]